MSKVDLMCLAGVSYIALLESKMEATCLVRYVLSCSFLFMIFYPGSKVSFVRWELAAQQFCLCSSDGGSGLDNRYE